MYLRIKYFEMRINNTVILDSAIYLDINLYIREWKRHLKQNEKILMSNSTIFLGSQSGYLLEENETGVETRSEVLIEWFVVRE